MEDLDAIRSIMVAWQVKSHSRVSVTRLRRSRHGGSL